MNRFSFGVLMILIAVTVLIAIWVGWRAVRARGARLASPNAQLSGEVIDTFSRVSYVSTTPAGAPFERVAIPGLEYKGYAEVEIFRDGVSIAVTGASPVGLSATQILGAATAQGRIGKVVERDGLSLLRWVATPVAGAVSAAVSAADKDTSVELESSFRFADPALQHRFAEAIAKISTDIQVAEPSVSVGSDTLDIDDTNQEDT